MHFCARKQQFETKSSTYNVVWRWFKTCTLEYFEKYFISRKYLNWNHHEGVYERFCLAIKLLCVEVKESATFVPYKFSFWSLLDIFCPVVVHMWPLSWQMKLSFRVQSARGGGRHPEAKRCSSKMQATIAWLSHRSPILMKMQRLGWN